MRWTILPIAALAAAGLASCQGHKTHRADTATVIGPNYPQSTLYHRLGGEEGIRDIVRGTTARVLDNPAVNFERRGTGREWHVTPSTTERLEERLTAYIGSLAGGPPYRGATMQEVHRGMRIDDREYDAFMSALVDTLRSRGVDPADGREVIRIFEGLRGDIVEVR
jgi:hemoglobin